MNILDETASQPEGDGFAAAAYPRPARSHAAMRLGLAMFLSGLRRHLLLILLVLGAVLGGTWLVLDYIPERYAARATLALTPADTRLNASDQVLETEALSRYQIETEMDFMQSHQFLAAVAARLELVQDPAFNPYLAGENAADGAQQMPPEAQLAAVAENLQKTYSLSRRGDSLAIDIRTRHGDPARAADIANAIAETYIASTLDTKRAEVQQSVDFLRGRVEAQSAALAESEIRIAGFIRSNQLDDPARTAEMQAGLRRLDSRLELARAEGAGAETIAGLEARQQALQAELNQRTRAELTLMNMERDFEAEVARYQTYVDRRNNLEAQIDILAPGARQITRAEVPSEPAFPRRGPVLAFGAVAGLLLAAAAAFLRELMDRRIWAGQHAEHVTGLANLAVVPHIGVRGLRQPRELVRHLLRARRSPYTEAMRGLLTVLPGASGGRRTPVLAITSALPNEGKSSLALSLALTAAQEGEKALLIDFDVHRHGLSHLAGAKPSQQTPAEAWGKSSQVTRRIQQDAVIPGVDLLNFKRDAATPRNLLDGPEPMRTLALLRDIYDLIILDTPPVLLAHDAVRVAALADTVLLVARWGRTTEEALDNAAGLLAMNRVHPGGTILNDVDLSRYQRYGYGAYYGSYYEAYGPDSS